MYPATPKLGKSLLGASTFFASAHPSESCGSNGLPLTPNSIRVLGRAKALRLINHKHLCTYVDIQRSKHERLMVIQEFYPLNLSEACQRYEQINSQEGLTAVAHQVLQGLMYLNNFGTVNRNLTPDNILIDPKGEAKLYSYGLYYMTEGGAAVSFPIGSPLYSAPEVIIGESCRETSASVNGRTCGNPAWDVWSLGIIIAELLLGLQLPDINGGVEETLEFVLQLTQVEDPLATLAQTCPSSTSLQALSRNMQDFLRSCLTVNTKDRPYPKTLLGHPLFDHLNIVESLQPTPPHFPVIDPSQCLVDFGQYKRKLGISEENYRDRLDNYPHPCKAQEESKVWRFSEIDHITERSIREVYHLWQLAGGDVEQELKRQKLIKTKPTILTLPSIMLMEGHSFPEGVQEGHSVENKPIVLPLENLKKRLASIPLEKHYPLVTQGELIADELEMSNLPLVIRERDVEYQFHRLLVFERLLKAYPFQSEALLREARKDTPPFYRALVWASLLHVDGNVAERFEEIDKETPTLTDRQIEVDIPRCHQYDELLSSPQGHNKFTRVLKAWVVSHPHLVYWQGLDSLCAPFLYLNFNNEALAYDCLSKFIDKYLHKFFLKDNSAVIQEYLAKFSHLIAFHDPELFNHLDEIAFLPELYAIPWFLTMYTHVFPLHKIFLLWDTLLLGGASLPLCVGVALLRQLRDRLLQFGFNECILLFSDMPDIAMEKVVKESVTIFQSMPASITFRQHERPSNDLSAKATSFYADPNKDLVMTPVALTQLKNEKCARISGADVLELLAHRCNKTGRGVVLVVDVRSPDEFQKGSLPKAINLPGESSITPEGEVVASAQKDILSNYKSKIIVIMGSKSNQAVVVKFAETLLSLGFPRICTLHGGVEVFRSCGALVTPA
ncbi:TBC domain-containing protein kinase-like protein [Oratosquilla oratoria]|uniref:TBC domain-containing protein kinase-like protein n=1 Tax=Oratosquilla oratoria TaxID=337810 RepID=UPI003F763204